MNIFTVQDFLMIGVDALIMTLSYKNYFLFTLMWPAIYLVFAIILLSLLYLSFTNKIKIFNIKYKTLVYIFLILSSFGLFYDSIPTIKYGIYLLTENESDTISTSGEITRIDDAYNSPRYYYEGISTRAKIITINDEQFYIYYIDGFQVGDNVTIEHLSKSTFVLSITFE